MTGSPQLLSTGFALASAACWGASDFSGGYASKRSDAFLVTMLAHASGFLLMTALAVVAGAPFPNRSGELWALAAGALGGTAFAVFFICINQTADNSAVWSAAHSRLASLTLVGAIVLAQRGPKTLHFTDATVAIFAGCLDSTGTLLFIRADQTGRLDAAVVLSS